MNRRTDAEVAMKILAGITILLGLFARFSFSLLSGQLSKAKAPPPPEQPNFKL